MFNKIDMEKYERKEHYEYYKKIIKTKLNMSYNFDITSLIKTVNENNLRFYPVFIYIIMRAVNDVKEMRMAIDSEGNLGYYSFCSPSYTIFHNDDKTFSDIWTEYNEDFKTFYQEAVNDMEKYKNIKGVKFLWGIPYAFSRNSLWKIFLWRWKNLYTIYRIHKPLRSRRIPYKSFYKQNTGNMPKF